MAAVVHVKTHVVILRNLLAARTEHAHIRPAEAVDALLGIAHRGEVARAVTGHPIPARIVERRAGDPAQLIASSEKAKKILGWNPQHAELEEIVASAWKWHKSHPHGFAD